MSDFPLVNLAKNAFSPTDHLLTDDAGIPSVMVRIPKFLISDVIAGGSDTVHPAFIVNGQEVDAIYISKFQNVLHDGRAYSLPLENPHAEIGFEAAQNACSAKGAGWHLMTRAEWAAIALWCRMNGTMPKGNNGYGKDHTESVYEAIPATYDGGNRQPGADRERTTDLEPYRRSDRNLRPERQRERMDSRLPCDERRNSGAG